MGSLGCARTAQYNIGSSVASEWSAHLNFTESKRMCKECTPGGFIDSKESLELLNNLEEEMCKGRHREETKL